MHPSCLANNLKSSENDIRNTFCKSTFIQRMTTFKSGTVLLCLILNHPEVDFVNSSLSVLYPIFVAFIHFFIFFLHDFLSELNSILKNRLSKTPEKGAEVYPLSRTHWVFHYLSISRRFAVAGPRPQQLRSGVEGSLLSDFCLSL